MITPTDSSNYTVVTAPSFIVKLWDMVNNPECQDIISWTPSGDTFVIKDKERLIFDLLPKYFKHNNLSSFIRQLNKYGFRKVHNIENNQEFEFANEYFVRDQPHCLAFIKRKPTEPRHPEAKTSDSDETLKDLLYRVQSLRKTQEVFETKVQTMQKQQEILCKETNELKRKQQLQQKIINNIMRFLANMVHQDENERVNRPVIFPSSQNVSNKNLMAITQNAHIDKLSASNPSLNSGGVYQVLLGNNVKVEPERELPGLISIRPDNSMVPTMETDIDEGACFMDMEEQTPCVTFPPEFDKATSLEVSDNQLNEFIMSPDVMNVGADPNLITGVDLDSDPDLLSTSAESSANIQNIDLNNFVIPATPGSSIAGKNTLEGLASRPSPEPSTSQNTPPTSPSQTNKKELGDHVSLMESNINNLKEVLSDTNLNLDMEEVLNLFSPEELSVIKEALE